MFSHLLYITLILRWIVYIGIFYIYFQLPADCLPVDAVHIMYILYLKVVETILPPLTTLAFSRNGKKVDGPFSRGKRRARQWKLKQMSVGVGGATGRNGKWERLDCSQEPCCVIPFFFLFHDPKIKKQIGRMQTIYRTDKLAWWLGWEI